VSAATIPVVDVSAERSSVIAALAQAYGEVGFAYVVGHGVDQALVDGVFRASAAFHALPEADKMSIELDSHHRGYIPIAVSTDRTSSVEVVTTPNQSASFMMMREDAPDSAEVNAGTYLSGANQWPELAGFRDAVESYHGALVSTGQRIVSLFADLLGDDTGELAAAFGTPTTWLRLLWYPSQSAAGADVYGSAPHRDFGCITLLAQDDVGGLQVRDRDGGWIDVPPRAGAFVMNVGDMLHRWSNGRLMSTPHRVVNRGDRARYSVPFFFDPHMSTVIRPLTSCVDLVHPARFEPVEFGAFVRSQLEATYDRHAPPAAPADRRGSDPLGSTRLGRHS
jgi:isopenicillin N synthase-like dioxygenase